MKRIILCFISLYLIIYPLTAFMDDTNSNVISTENIELYQDPQITRVHIEIQGGTPEIVHVGDHITFISILEGINIESLTISYQWQINFSDPNNESAWMDIDGATSSSYTVAASASNLGAYYRVAVHWEAN